MNLPAVSRADRLLLGIVLVVAALLGLIVWLFHPPEKTGGMIELPSTFYNASYGTKASYLMLEQLQFPMTRLRRPIVPETLEGIGTLFILKPLHDLEKRELTELEDWVKTGHTLVVAPSTYFSSRAEPGSFGEWFRMSDASDDKDSDGIAAKVPNDHPQATVHEATLTDGQALDAAESIVAGLHKLTTSGVHRFSADHPCGGPLAEREPHLFWKDQRGAIGLRLTVGEGEIIALSDTYPFSNRGVGQADNSLLLGNIAQRSFERCPGQIAFDEFHLGFRQQVWSPLAMAKLMLAGDWRWAVLQVLFVGLLALAAGAVRFGSPLGVARKPRRQQREFAEAAGRFLDEAGATALAAETLGRHYRGQLCKLAHLDPEADDRRLAAAIQRRIGRDITRLLADARTAATAPVSRQRLFAISRELYHVVETLGHGT